MPVKTFVGLCYEPAVKPSFASARLVTADQKNGLPFRVKGEGNAPNAIGGIESKLLHIWVAGAVKSIDAGPADLRTKLFEQLGMSEHFVLHGSGQGVEFRIELLMKRHFPLHL